MSARDVLDASECPVGRGAAVVADPWATLILRDCIHGITRFDEFRQHLSVSPTVLTQRLRDLVTAGVLVRHQYEQHPPRHEYVLTDRGRELATVLVALGGWFNDGLESTDRAVVFRDAETGAEVEPVVVDRRTGAPIQWPRHRFSPGPAASPRVRSFIAAHDLAGVTS